MLSSLYRLTKGFTATSINTAHPIVIRLATPNDAEGIRAVYAPYVSTPVTFEEEEPAAAGYCAKMEQIMLFYPCLVACSGTNIVGFAYAHRQAERAAYDWNAELSIYLDQRITNAGIGSSLYRALMDLLALQGIRTVYARVTLPNPASERLHATFGFELTWVQKNAGFRLGRWRDVAWYVKQINPYDGSPARPVAFPALLKERPRHVEAIIAKAAQ